MDVWDPGPQAWSKDAATVSLNSNMAKVLRVVQVPHQSAQGRAAMQIMAWEEEEHERMR